MKQSAATRPGPLTFDPVALGRAECDAWAAYYRREWLSFLRSAVRMVRAGFGMNRRRTLLGAWHVLRANQLWAPYPDNDPAGARAAMQRFYVLVAAGGHGGFDPALAARLEVGWWRVHREHQHDIRVQEPDLVDALAALYGHVYGLPESVVRRAAQLRVDAMDASDRWVAAGCSLDDPLLARERRLLVASFSALRDAVDRRGEMSPA
ncbi:MAG TPA: hypothetical protein VIU11_01995 [Nakamurella sp.]